MANNRPWKSFAEQLELLKSRGMVVTDEAAALSYLECIGYYRLTAYWYSFRLPAQPTAHHSRLWNRNVTDQPGLPNRGELAWCDDFIGKADLIAKPFLLLAIARHMAKVVCPRTEWHVHMQHHLQKFPPQHSRRKLSIADMGAPAGRENWWIGEIQAGK